jgi:hypothetical protein
VAFDPSVGGEIGKTRPAANKVARRLGLHRHRIGHRPQRRRVDALAPGLDRGEQ